MKANFGIFKTQLKNPFGLLINGAGAMKTALMAVGKVVWIQLLIAAVVIFKKMWDTNIGGIQKHFFRVVGAFQNGVGKIMGAFVRFVQKVSPMVEPFFEMMADMLIPIITNVMDAIAAFLDSGDAVQMFGDIFMPIFKGVKSLMGAIIPIIQSLIGGFQAGGKTGSGAFGDIFKAVGAVIGGVMEFLAALFRIWDAIGVFKVVGFIFKLIALGVSTVVGFIQVLVEWLVVAIENFEKLFFWRKKDREESDKAAEDEEKRAASVQATSASKEEAAARANINNNRQTTINNNPLVNVHSSGPISAGSAPMIGDILASSLTIDQARM
jgi:hypothetical protein